MEVKKATPQKQFQTLNTTNQGPPTKRNAVNLGKGRVEARNSNFSMFFEHKSEESHLVSLMYEYWSVNIQFICNIKKNKFKPGLEIKTKENDCTTVDTKGIISLLQAFHVYT